MDIIVKCFGGPAISFSIYRYCTTPQLRNLLTLENAWGPLLSLCAIIVTVHALLIHYYCYY